MRNHSPCQFTATKCRAALAATLLAIAAITVRADPLHGQTGDGTQLHIGIGWGSRHCDECGGRFGGLAGEVAVGTRITPRILVGGLLSGWLGNVRDEGELGTTGYQIATALTLVARTYVTTTGPVFLLTGVGLGLSSRGLATVETGVALIGGLGYDWVASQAICLTPFVNGIEISGVAGGTTMLQVGLGITTR